MSTKKNGKKVPSGTGRASSSPRKYAVKTGRAANDGDNSSQGNGLNAIKKQYLKSQDACNVTFTLPKEAAPDAHVITVVGDFNEWNESETPMKKMKNGDFKVTVKLSSGREYKFRYLIDSTRWENDWHADKYAPNEYGCDDSIVVV